VYTYTYDAANRLTSVGGVAYTWDDNGNLLGDGVRTFTYDDVNRLVQVVSGTLTTTFAYPSTPLRVTSPPGSLPLENEVQVASQSLPGGKQKGRRMRPRMSHL